MIDRRKGRWQLIQDASYHRKQRRTRRGKGGSPYPVITELVNLFDSLRYLTFSARCLTVLVGQFPLWCVPTHEHTSPEQRAVHRRAPLLGERARAGIETRTTGGSARVIVEMTTEVSD